mmetsp:Transcript_22916/g.28112  ORF Transcript_22916/g.28112 Transcript_22916/m.28112 type:complete len:346 (-) Transcript_22916:242-1279(-)
MQIMANTSPSQLSVESLFPPLSPNDGSPKFLRGIEAQLQPLRFYNDPKNMNIILQFESKIDNNVSADAEVDIDNGNKEKDKNEKLVSCTSLVSVTSTCQNMASSQSFTQILGSMFVTTKRLLFVATNENEKEHDFAIDAHCISLHAMMSEPESSVYCQLSDDCVINQQQGQGDADEDDDEVDGPVEIIFIPQSKKGANDITEKKELCQMIFDSLSQLINLNPIYDDDDDGTGAGGGGLGGLASMLEMMENSYNYEYDDEDENEDENSDMICRLDPSQIANHEGENDQTDDGDEVNSSKRTQMLERLDKMLVVPPEYQIHDGQFDDADEEDAEMLNNDDGEDDDIL